MNGSATVFSANGTLYAKWTENSVTQPTVTTLAASDITQTTATLNKSITSGSETITSRGFKYKKSSESSWTPVTTSTNNASYNLSGLVAGTTYQFYAYATTASRTTNGEAKTFTTLPSGGNVQTWEIGYPNAADVIATLNGGTLTITAPNGNSAMKDFYNGDGGYITPWFGEEEDEIINVIINSGVTTIGAGAFISCNNLNSVTLSNSVRQIGNSAFSSCKSLQDVTVNCDNPIPITNYVFDGGTNLSNVNLHVPSGTECAYAAADVWKDFNIQNVERTITFNAQGGSVSPISKDVNCQSQAGTLPTPTRDGYTFGGWFTGTNGSGTQYTATTTVTGDVTLYAKWTARDYSIITDENGGNSVADLSYTVSTSSQNKSLTQPTYATTYTVSYNANGHGSVPSSQTSTKPFSHWSITSNSSVCSVNGNTLTINANATGNITVTAQWGAQPAIALRTPAAVTGYTFGGWYSDVACTNFVGNAGASYTPTGNKTLYAKWTEKTLSVSPTSYNFSASGGTSSSISITSNQSWTISDNASWLTTSKTSGSGNSTFTMTASENTSASSRSATVTITGGTSGTATITVTQDGVSTYTITAQANGGGNIAPSGSILVGKGNSQRFEFTPNSGYEINQVLIDGQANSTAKSNGYYVFQNVTADHTIVVSFMQSVIDPPTVVTLSATKITQSSATLNKTVTVGSESITEQGFKIRAKVAGSQWTTRIFTASSLTVTGLTANTTYEFRAYATTASGTINGETLEFKTENVTAVSDSEFAPTTVYPNPTTGQLRIKNSKLKAGEAINVYTAAGQLVAQFTTTGPETVIDLSRLTAGVYVVHIGEWAEKVVKE